MASHNEEVFRKVVERLSKMAAPRNRAGPITGDTHIYRDLGIYGDEIVDLVRWLDEEFGVKPSINLFRHAPQEFPFSGAFRTIRRFIGVEPQYESLKVRDIIAAIETKSWPDEAASRTQ
jgi:hypothetical protein